MCDPGRLRLDAGFDYVPLGSSEYSDAGLGSYARFEGHWWAVAPALALDVVSTPRLLVDAHVGVDYTWLTLERHVLVGTFGCRFR